MAGPLCGRHTGGLVGFFNYNLVDKIFGVGSGASRVVYALVGVAALYLIYTFTKLVSKEA